ncbi:MAG TPA: DUF3179 domain-containing protein [Gemmatimonadota bacterium]|nr:DUF3179 domain-containing protein [Gemmatimonadota bacterium]
MLGLLLTSGMTLVAQTKNGFDLSGALVPVDEILSGGPPRDGIPALTDPPFERVPAVDWLKPGDRLLALEHGGVAKAYPIRILNWHEVVNDRVGSRAVAITYCPLCGTGMAFDLAKSEAGRPFLEDRQPLELGVSGLLYNSDVLMYDRQTESLWTQIGRQAIAGPLRSERLAMIPLLHTTWGRWQEEHPDGLVLSRNTGHGRDYDTDPYMSYERSTRTMFPVAHRDDRLPEKDLVLGITRGDGAVAFPLDRLAERPRPVRATVGGEELFVYWFPDSETAFATSLNGNPVPATIAYWFAWSAFHPSTRVWIP